MKEKIRILLWNLLTFAVIYAVTLGAAHLVGFERTVLALLVAAAFYTKEGEIEVIEASITRSNVQTVHVVFDGPPSHESGRFVECETPNGKGIRLGEWKERADGYWVLEIQAVVKGEEE